MMVMVKVVMSSDYGDYGIMVKYNDRRWDDRKWDDRIWYEVIEIIDIQSIAFVSFKVVKLS